MEGLGHAAIQPQSGGRKANPITAEGEAALAEKKATVDGIFRRMEDVHARFDHPAPHIGRAMANLGKAIGIRMSSGAVSPEQLDIIVTAIDEAARKVEKA